MEAYETTSLERPRRRRLFSFFVIILSVALFGGAAAWVVQTYVAPPLMAAYQPLLLAAQGAISTPETPPASEPQPAPEPHPSLETTGSAAPAREAPRPLPMIASLAIVPPFSHPWNGSVPATAAAVPDTAAEELVTDGQPIAGPIPLPQPRPQFSTAGARSIVPLPRPRPN